MITIRKRGAFWRVAAPDLAVIAVAEWADAIKIANKLIEWGYAE